MKLLSTITASLLAFIISAIPTLASAKEGSLLRCATDGPGIASLEIYKWGKSDYSAAPGGRTTITIAFEEMEEGQAYDPSTKRPQIFETISGIAALENGESSTVIATEENSPIFKNVDPAKVVNVNEHSVLLRLLDGQKNAFLAKDGVVYKLHCY